LCRALKAYPNVEVVGDAGDAYEAISRVATLQPAVAVIDMDMTKMDGIEASRLIKEQYPRIAVIGLSLVLKDHQLYQMQKIGALEVIRKERADTELYHAIQRALAFVQPALISKEPPISEQRGEGFELSANELIKKTDELIGLLGAERLPPL
jgi:DNA-binding NarL/FixJ family response regulator